MTTEFTIIRWLGVCGNVVHQKNSMEFEQIQIGTPRALTFCGRNRKVLACTLINWSFLGDCRIIYIFLNKTSTLSLKGYNQVSFIDFFLATNGFFDWFDFWYSLVWNIEVDAMGFFFYYELDFLSTVACRIQVWNKLKVKSIKLDTYFKLENVKCSSLHKYWNISFDHRFK